MRQPRRQEHGADHDQGQPERDRDADVELGAEALAAALARRLLGGNHLAAARERRTAIG